MAESRLWLLDLLHNGEVGWSGAGCFQPEALKLAGRVGGGGVGRGRFHMGMPTGIKLLSRCHSLAYAYYPRIFPSRPQAQRRVFNEVTSEQSGPRLCVLVDSIEVRDY